MPMVESTSCRTTHIFTQNLPSVSQFILFSSWNWTFVPHPQITTTKINKFNMKILWIVCCITGWALLRYASGFYLILLIFIFYGLSKKKELSFNSMLLLTLLLTVTVDVVAVGAFICCQKKNIYTTHSP